MKDRNQKRFNKIGTRLSYLVLAYICINFVYHYVLKKIYIVGGTDEINTVYLIWGPPGAGKSTLVDKYPENTILKNTDHIVKFICPEELNQEKYWQCRKDDRFDVINNYLDELVLDQDKHIGIETTGNKLDIEWVKSLKTKFQKVVIMCIYINDETKHWDRIKNRTQLSISKTELGPHRRNAYYNNMKQLIGHDSVDEIYIYDNSGDDGKSKLLCSYTKEGIYKQLKPLPDSIEYQNWFLDQVNKT